MLRRRWFAALASLTLLAGSAAACGDIVVEKEVPDGTTSDPDAGAADTDGDSTTPPDDTDTTTPPDDTDTTGGVTVTPCAGDDDLTDDDGDGTPNGCDLCPGSDDALDADEDDVPDGCDLCEGSDDALDTDGDTIPNGCDTCVGDDTIDTDSDSVPDACDQCDGIDDLADADTDGTPDCVDVCDGFDDALDDDTDTVPNGCDACPAFDDLLDTDGDGVPNGCDVCAAGDDNVDSDVDGVPDSCDMCPDFDDAADNDSDGAPDACDMCEGFDDAIDTDGDFAPDGCDLCEGYDDALDGDSDGVPDDCDVCTLGDDALDDDTDDVPDACDLCPGIHDDELATVPFGGMEDATDWQTSGGAVVEVTELGQNEPGVGRVMLTTCGIGGAGGFDSNPQVCLPPYDPANPLALRVSGRLDCTCPGDCACLIPSSGEITVGVGDDYMTRPILAGIGIGGAWEMTDYCLGEAAYGQILPVHVNLTGGYDTCPLSTNWIDIDTFHFSPVPTNVCPLPGQVLNGNFDGGSAGWTGSVSEQAEGTNFYLQVDDPAGCTGPTPKGAGTVSIRLPASMANPRLQWQWDGNFGGVGGGGGATMRILDEAGPTDLKSYATTLIFPGWKDDAACVPAQYAGHVVTLEIEMNNPCGASTPQFLKLDNIELVDDASACP